MKKKILLYCFIGLFICLSISYVVISFVANAKLAAAQAAILEAGYPADESAFICPIVPDHDNAAIDYEEANNLLEKLNWGAISIDLNDDSLFSEENFLAISTFLNQGKTNDLFKLLHEANIKPHCQFVDDFSDGPKILMPHISWEIPIFLNAAFYTYMHHQEYKQAFKVLELHINYCTQMYAEPFLISHLVKCSSYQRIFPGLRYLYRSYEFDIVKLLSKISHKSIHDGLITAIHAERVLFADWVFNQDNHNSKFIGYLVDSNLRFYSMTPLWTLDHAASLRASLGMVDYVNTPYSGNPPVFRLKSYNYISNQIAPGYYSSLQTTLNCQADFEITKAGIACLQHFKKHQRYPKTPEEIGSFKDPFTGKALLYKSDANGFSIRSMGKNLDATDKEAPQWLYATEPNNNVAE